MFIHSSRYTASFVKDALHDRLDETITYDARALPCFDSVRPQDEPMPYLRLGPFITTPNVGGAQGGGYYGAQRVRGQIDVFSDYRGTKEVDDILALVQGELGSAELLLDGGLKVTLARIELTTTREEQQRGTITQHGVIDLICRVQVLTSTAP